MFVRLIFLFCLGGISTLANATQGVLKCHAGGVDDEKEIGGLTIDFDHLKVKASNRTYNMGGETMDIQKVGSKKGVETYRGTNDGGDELTFYVPENSTGSEIILDWRTDGDGNPINSRYALVCKSLKSK